MRLLRKLSLLLLVIAAATFAWIGWHAPVASSPREIFRGVTYQCLALDESAEGSGLAHIVEVDLAAPGIELFVTPLDAEAVGAGHEYRLAWPASVLHEERLAVVINGTLHSSDSLALPLPGDFADSIETVVAAGTANRRDENSYLLWFDEKLVPTLETAKPPAEAALARAKWGISGQQVALYEGALSEFLGRDPDRRTILGIDPARKRLWLAVFAHASPRRAAETLAACGAKSAILLDGGDSTTMALARGGEGAPSGTLLGGWRPVATSFGLRAARLD